MIFASPAIRRASNGFVRTTWLLLLGLSCSHCSEPERTVPALPKVEIAARPASVREPSDTRDAAVHAEDEPLRPPQDAAAQAATSAREPAQELYGGTHKLGVNRVTNMARVGSATFSERDGILKLEARVARGQHWLSLSGDVQPRGDKEFVLTGVMQGIPDMAWAGEAPRERRTEGRFTFQVKHNRPYWRLYRVNDRPCVCDERCGNDFCYVDIELARSSAQPQ